MDTQAEKHPEFFDFPSFIKQYFDWYEIDGTNEKILENISLWANRNPKFNDIEPGWHIDRGLLFCGSPGVGKDELLRLTNQYLKYLRSPYNFSHRVVWEFASQFQSKDNGGYVCFAGEGKGNRHYEELALTDPATGYPTREVVNNFGTKVLIGAELIHVTHNAFKNSGVQSHFTTNEPKERLAEFYGERAMSRLKYMCNFFEFYGKDRRENATPVFMRNINQPIIPRKPRDISKETEIENKTILEDNYAHFLATGDIPKYASLTYNQLVAYGVSLIDEEGMRLLKEMLAERYVPQISLLRKNDSDKEDEKRNFVQTQSKVMAVGSFFTKLKTNGAKTIFGEKKVDVDELAENIKK